MLWKSGMKTITNPSAKPKVGDQVVVLWDTDDQRDTYGFEQGTVIDFSPKSQLYKVEHTGRDDLLYYLSYQANEISPKLIYRLILKAHNNNIIDMNRVMKYRHILEELLWTVGVASLLVLSAFGLASMG